MVARVQKQRDKLLQWDAETHQRIVDLLDEMGTERELKLRAKERYTALEQRQSWTLRWSPSFVGSSMSYSKPWRGFARSTVRSAGSATRPCESVMRQSRGSSPSRLSLIPRRLRSWRPRVPLPVLPGISPKRGVFFRRRVTSSNS